MKNEEIRIIPPRTTPTQQNIINNVSILNSVAIGDKKGNTTLGI
nr:hypothetical protein K54LAMBDA2_LOCUS22 [Klebsiella phage vB_Kpn_K54lambda2]